MRPSGRAPLLALGGGLLLAIAVAVGVVLGSGEVEEPVAIADSESESDSFRSPPPGSDSESDSESGSESESESEPAPAPTETITLHVDEAARLVLVDGERQSDRPLRIALLPDQVVSVELVAPSGELVAHRVGAEDDGRTLTLPEARARMGRSRGGMMTSGSGTMMRRAILGNPY